MHRAFIGAFRQSLARLSGERAFTPDGGLDSVAGNAIELMLADGDCLLVSSHPILCNDHA
jgi:hypothetical protein